MSENNLFNRRALNLKRNLEAELQHEIETQNDTIRLIARRYIGNINVGLTLEMSQVLEWDHYEDYAISLLVKGADYVPTFLEYQAISSGADVSLEKPDLKNLLMMLMSLHINNDLDNVAVTGNLVNDQKEISKLCFQVFNWKTESDLIMGVREILYNAAEVGW